MKKMILVLITLVVAGSSILGQFRDTKWGMSRGGVIKSERLEPLKIKNEGIIYKEYLYDNEVDLVYLFLSKENKLYAAMYLVKQQFEDLNMYFPLV